MLSITISESVLWRALFTYKSTGNQKWLIYQMTVIVPLMRKWKTSKIQVQLTAILKNSVDLEKIGLVSHTTFACAPVCRQSTILYSENFDNDDHHTHDIYATLKISTPTIAVIESTRAGDRWSISDHYIVLQQPYWTIFLSNCIDQSNRTFAGTPVLWRQSTVLVWTLTMLTYWHKYGIYDVIKDSTWLIVSFDKSR